MRRTAAFNCDCLGHDGLIYSGCDAGRQVTEGQLETKPVCDCGGRVRVL